jgi:hypothetical protein
MIEDVLQENGGGVGEEHPVDRIDADEEPIEVLVQLAEDGEIDPWNIDIVQVTDKFLERLDAGDLRASARALFYASVLLRMKSDAFLAPDEPEEPDPLADAWGDRREDPSMAAPDGPDPIGALDRELERRLERKRVRGGTPETLDELVRELREQERDSGGNSTGPMTPPVPRRGSGGGPRPSTTAATTRGGWPRSPRSTTSPARRTVRTWRRRSKT